MSAPLVQIDDLTVRYGTLTAAQRISLTIPAGEIFGLVGPNGAGKTTTLKVLAGLLLPDGGQVRVDGLDVVTHRDEVRRRIGYMADFFGVYDYLTAQEYLAFFGGMYGVPPEELDDRIARILETVNLTAKRHAYVRTLSRGMKQRLYFARVLVHEPMLLVLDEPASGMDPRGRAELVETLKAANRNGQTIVISSHILDELQDLCTSVGIMEASRLVAVRALHRADTAGPRRQVVLVLAAEDVARALEVVRTHVAVFSARPGAGGIVLEVQDDDAAVAGLVRDLVQADIRLLLPRTDGEDLKEIFLKMTRGELM